MRVVDRIRVLLRSWFQPTRVDDDFGEELTFHLERQIQINLDAGMTPDAARRAAHLSFGHLDSLKETSRDRRSGSWVRQTVRDIAYGWRLLRRSPGFAFAGVLIVALGVGATTTIFSVLYGVVLRPLPYDEPERLVGLWTRLRPLDASGRPLQMNVEGRIFVNGADYRDWRADNRVFEDIALVRHIANFNLIGSGEPERLFAARISPNLFTVLGVTPALGRPFSSDEDSNGRDRVVLLSDGLWKRRFGSDPSIVGRTINLSGVSFTVVGVMKPDFQYPGREHQLWVPLTINPAELARKEPGYNHIAVARLKPGVTLERARSDMSRMARALAEAYPASNAGATFEVDPLLEEALGGVRPALYLVFGAVTCLLLVSCLNLANLLGARAAVRHNEFAVRQALGAPRGRLALQALAEVTPILVIGGALGVGVAAWSLAAFIPLAPATLPRVENIELDGPVLIFSLGTLFLTGLLAGLVPAAYVWRSDFVTATRERGRSTTGGRAQSRTRNALVVAQIALVLPLLVGAGLMVRSFSALVDVDPGFRPNNVLSLSLAIPRSKYTSDEQIAAVTGRLVERTAQVAGVDSVAMVNRLPLGGGTQTLMIEFEARDGATSMLMIDSRTITPAYFQTMGIPLMDGRAFTDRDIRTAPIPGIADSAFPTTGIVDAQLAQRIWPNDSAIGRRFRIAFPGVPWTEVIGVVGHVRHEGLEVDPREQVYFNYWQRPQDRMVLVVRGANNTTPSAAAIVQAVHDVDPEQPVYDVKTMTDVVGQSTLQWRLSSLLVALFAGVALVIASMGLYGTVAYGVAQRKREFGIRMAFGATRQDITAIVLRLGTRLALIGVVLGGAASVAVTRTMEGLLFGVKPLDLWSFAGAATLLLAVALSASYLPARQASTADPTAALRSD